MSLSLQLPDYQCSCRGWRASESLWLCFWEPEQKSRAAYKERHGEVWHLLTGNLLWEPGSCKRCHQIGTWHRQGSALCYPGADSCMLIKRKFTFCSAGISKACRGIVYLTLVQWSQGRQCQLNALCMLSVCWQPISSLSLDMNSTGDGRGSTSDGHYGLSFLNNHCLDMYFMHVYRLCGNVCDTLLTHHAREGMPLNCNCKSLAGWPKANSNCICEAFYLLKKDNEIGVTWCDQCWHFVHHSC